MVVFDPADELLQLIKDEGYAETPLPFDLSDQKRWRGAWGAKGDGELVIVEPSFRRPYFYVTWGSASGSYQRLERPVHLYALGSLMHQLGIDVHSFEWEVMPGRPFDNGGTPSQNETPLVYFIEGGGLIKIGVALAPIERIQQLQSMSPVPLRLVATMAGGYPQERLLHSRFANCHSHGEWYFPAAELLEYIIEVSK